MKSRIYACITLQYSAATTSMSNLCDPREFIHQDLLVKGTKAASHGLTVTAQVTLFLFQSD